jgi:hypothetical protein
MLLTHMFPGMRKMNARAPNAIEYKSPGANADANINPTAAKNAAIEDSRARVRRVIQHLNRIVSASCSVPLA